MTPDELAHLAERATAALAERDAAIIQAAQEGMPQPVIAEAAGLTTERVRQIERKADLPPRRRGRPRNETA